MDGKGFQVWLSAGARANARAAARGACGAVGPERGRGIEGRDRAWVWTRPGAVRTARAKGRFRAVWHGVCGATSARGCGRTFNALTGTPLSGLHHKERWLSFGASLAEGETVKASAARCDVAVSTAFRWRHRFLAAARSDSEVLKGIVGSGRDLRPGEPEGCARAGTQGTAAGRQGEEARPFARAGAGSHGGGPERDDGQRGAAPGRCDGAHRCPRPGGREGRPAGFRRWRELPTLRRRARGEPRSSQPLDGGTGSGRSARADGEQPPQPVEGLLASPAVASPPAIWTTT